MPDDLLLLAGKRDEKRSLQTRHPAEAKRRHAEALAELEVRWANLRAGPKALTEREAHQMASPYHDLWLAQHRDNPGGQTLWDTDLGPRLFLPPKAVPTDQSYDASFFLDFDKDTFRLSALEAWCTRGADECLGTQGMMVDDQSRQTLAKAWSVKCLMRHHGANYHDDAFRTIRSYVKTEDAAVDRHWHWFKYLTKEPDPCAQVRTKKRHHGR